jgi:hypothetical protein
VPHQWRQWQAPTPPLTGAGGWAGDWSTTPAGGTPLSDEELPDFSRSLSSSPQVAALSAIRRLKRLRRLLLALQVGTAVVLLQVATREVLPLCLQAPTQEQPSGASSLAGSP